jgi:hypothetical protein
MGMGANQGNRPVYRNRSHAYSCRCPQCSKPGDYGLIGPLVLIFFAVALVGFWPAMVWHGYTDTGGWRWDIHSTVAEGVYVGVIAFIGVLAWAGNKQPEPVAPKAVTELRPPPPSVCVPAPRLCLHPGAVKVNSSVYPDLTYRCWCPGCGTGLPAAFRWACCGAAPGSEPGDSHTYNCPQGLKEMTP